MNFLAGVAIGWLNDGWPARLAIPFAWGVIWCLRLWSLGRHREPAVVKRGLQAGKNPTIAFLMVEYGTAVSTSLAASLVAGLVRVLTD